MEKLQLDDLSVESFQTDPVSDQRGTVAGQQDLSGYEAFGCEDDGIPVYGDEDDVFAKGPSYLSDPCICGGTDYPNCVLA